MSTLPTITYYRPRNCACVRLGESRVLLGPWTRGGPSDEALARYDEVIAQWLARGRRWGGRAADSVESLGDAYVAWAREYYRKGGRATTAAYIAERSFVLLYRAGLADGPPSAFGPAQLRAFQSWLSSHPDRAWNRATINEYVRHVVAAFRRAVEEETIPESTWRALTAVRPLRAGRPAPGGEIAREGSTIEPVDEASIEAARREAEPMIRAMIDLQLLTGMRPTELVSMRGSDTAPTTKRGVYVYRVADAANKLAHKGQPRTVYIGPRGMAVLRPWLPTDPDSPVWSPRRAQEQRSERLRASRRSKAYSTADERREQRGQQQRQLLDAYTVNAYRLAVYRACDRAGIPRWAPNRLRHNAASVIAARESLDVARILLGHSSVATTLIYAKPDERRAASAALKHG